MSKYTMLLNKLVPELQTLENIETDLELVENRLEHLYDDVFPKICTKCDRYYKNREEYIDQTEKIGRGTAPDGNLESKGKIYEFRNCLCGSTLVVVTACRRDHSEIGLKRRELFQSCMTKFTDEYDINSETAAYLLRFLFSNMRSKTLQLNSGTKKKVA